MSKRPEENQSKSKSKANIEIVKEINTINKNLISTNNYAYTEDDLQSIYIIVYNYVLFIPNSYL